MTATTTTRPRSGALLPTIVIATVLAMLATIFSYLWTSKLWFESLGYTRVFWTRLGARAGLFVGFGLLMAAAVTVSIVAAFRWRPRTRPTAPTSVALERYREMLEERLWVVAGVPAALLGLMSGWSAAAEADVFLAWTRRASFGQTDPRFGLDVGFYVFEYPWWRFVLSFALSVVAFAGLSAAIVHFAVGSFSFSGRKRQVSRAAQVQLSVVAVVGLVLYGLWTLLGRYGVQVTTNSRFTGMNYTDDHARLGASLVVAIIAFLVAALFGVNIVLRRWIQPLAAIVLMVVSGMILSLIYPAAVQAISVRPNEPDRERPYIERHIAATRAAYGLDKVEVSDYAATTTVSAGQLRSDAESLPGIRLIDPAIVGATFEQLQQVRGYYSFPSVLDVDRYQVDGTETDVVVAARELDQGGLPDHNWNTIHTVYTHGNGLVAAYGNRRQTAGEPDWLARDIPPTGKLAEHEARIYYGEKLDTFAVVGRRDGEPAIELDTPGGGEQGGETTTVYDGEGGVAIGSWFRRALYAIRFGDINLLLSNRVNPRSKILYDRTPAERVQAVAPWLTVDSNVLPTIVDGRIVWIVDGYTTSNSYPNSHRITLRNAISDAQTTTNPAEIPAQINYMRNSVKATVDAYDGTVTLYAWDDTDPLLKAWSAVYPGTVRPRTDIEPSLLSHLRYPEDMFKVQREVLGRYHMTDPMTWFNQPDLWVVPADPVRGSSVKEPPYYLTVKMPGDSDATFSQTSVFVPNNRSNLASYMAVNADARSADYGRIRILRMSGTHQIDGPGQTYNAINTDTTVANKLRPFVNQGTAEAKFGNLLTLPVGGGLLYVQPIYTMRPGNNGANYPALRFVVVRFGEHVGIGDTLQQALDEVFKGDSGAATGEDDQGDSKTDTGKPDETGPADTAAAAAALEDAEQAFADADAALRRGDLATYQAKTAEAKALVAKALRALGR